MRWAGNIVLTEGRSVSRFRWGNLKRPLERRRRRWEGNIKIHLREIVWECIDLIDIAQVRERRWALGKRVMKCGVS